MKHILDMWVHFVTMQCLDWDDVKLRL